MSTPTQNTLAMHDDAARPSETRTRQGRTVQSRTLRGRALRWSAVGAVGILALSGCGTAAQDAGSGESASASSSESSTAQASLTVKDAWAKAADHGMTAVFGTVTNDGDEAVTLTGASTDAAGMVELHETVKDEKTGATMMQAKEGGFTLEPGESLELEPGGNHLMLMDLSCALQPGDTLELTLRTEDGQEAPFSAAIRDYSAAQEDYNPDAQDMDHSEHSDHAEHAEHSEGMASEGAESEHEGHGEHSEHADHSEHSQHAEDEDAEASPLPACGDR